MTEGLDELAEMCFVALLMDAGKLDSVEGLEKPRQTQLYVNVAYKMAENLLSERKKRLDKTEKKCIIGKKPKDFVDLVQMASDGEPQEGRNYVS